MSFQITNCSRLIMYMYISQVCLEGTERLSVDHTHLTHLLSMLTRLADVAVTFDPSLILLCWKFLGKLVFRTRSHLPNVIQTIWPIIEHLSITMETKTEECVLNKHDGDEGTGQLFVKLLKLCRFLSTLLVRMLSVSCPGAHMYMYTIMLSTKCSTITLLH